jgi:excisionase family DNA binding protein
VGGHNVTAAHPNDSFPPTLRDEYMTSREAAQYLHVSHRSLLEWARRGDLPAIPLGGPQRKTWLFCRSALDEHLRSMMTSNRPRSNQETAYVN